MPDYHCTTEKTLDSIHYLVGHHISLPAHLNVLNLKKQIITLQSVLILVDNVIYIKEFSLSHIIFSRILESGVGLWLLMRHYKFITNINLS